MCIRMKREIERLEELTGGVNAYLGDGGKLKPKDPKESMADDVTTSGRKPRARMVG